MGSLAVTMFERRCGPPFYQETQSGQETQTGRLPAAIRPGSRHRRIVSPHFRARGQEGRAKHWCGKLRFRQAYVWSFFLLMAAGDVMTSPARDDRKRSLPSDR